MSMARMYEYGSDVGVLLGCMRMARMYAYGSDVGVCSYAGPCHG